MREKGKRIKARTDNDSMPIAEDKLTAEEKELVAQWLDAGMPE